MRNYTLICSTNLAEINQNHSSKYNAIFSPMGSTSQKLDGELFLTFYITEKRNIWSKTKKYVEYYINYSDNWYVYPSFIMVEPHSGLRDLLENTKKRLLTEYELQKLKTIQQIIVTEK